MCRRSTCKRGNTSFPCYFSHTMQTGRHVFPALCPGRGRRHLVPLGCLPFLHSLRRQVLPGIVRLLLGYYADIRLPTSVHDRPAAFGLPGPSFLAIFGRNLWDLPVPVHGVSARGRVSNGAGPGNDSRISLFPVLPSASLNSVGVPDKLISPLNSWPVRAPVNASPSALRPPAHDSGSVWVATPSP